MNYKEIVYSNNWSKWVKYFNTKELFWYCWETKSYKPIRSLEILKEIFDDEDYHDGVFFQTH